MNDALVSLHKAANDRQRRGDPIGAEARYLALLQANPSDADAWGDLASLLADLEHLPAAEVAARRAAELAPESGKIASCLGNILHRLQRYSEALEWLDKAVEAGDAGALCNRALARYESGDLTGSQADFLRAMSQPDIDQQWASCIAAELAYPTLAAGDLRRGYALMEHRWNRLYRSQAWDLGIPEWQGEDLEGKRILIHQDQGYGDTIQYYRFIADLNAESVVLAIPEPLIELFVYKCEVVNIDHGLPKIKVDYHLPISSLPYRLNVSLDDIKGDAYLSQLHTWIPRFDKFNIGLIWAANPRLYGGRRSIPLTDLIPLALLPHVQLHSLQWGEAGKDIDKVGARAFIEDHGPRIKDFADLAVLMRSMNLVVSVDTAPLHLAGALGVPCVGLLDYARCWRWLRDRNDTPWYSSMQLIQQDRPGDWWGVVRELADFIAAVRDHARAA